MEIPDELLLAKIKESSLYLDKKSTEKTTGIEKSKYKLARSIILEQYLFHILTKNKCACKNALTLTIKRDEWLGIVSDTYLNEQYSYCDISKHDMHSETELLIKMKDPGNGFPFVAELSPGRYDKLLKLCRKVKYIPGVSDEAREIIELSLKDIFDAKFRELQLH